MDKEGDNRRTAKDRKVHDIQKAVKGNWDKANWKVRSSERLLEAKLREYQEQRRKSLRFLDLRKYDLEKKLVDTTMARPKHIEKDNKMERLARDIGHMTTQTDTSTCIKDGKESDKSNCTTLERRQTVSDRIVSLRDQSDTHKVSISGQQSRLPGMRALARQNVDQDTKTENIGTVSRRTTQRLSVLDSIPGGQLTGARKASSCEHIGRETTQTSFFPEISDRNQRRQIPLDRSRSYTVGENSNVYIPMRERKKGVYQLQPAATMDYGHRSKPEVRPSSEKSSSLEEQFEKLQSCRYLRSNDR